MVFCSVFQVSHYGTLPRSYGRKRSSAAAGNYEAIKAVTIRNLEPAEPLRRPCRRKWTQIGGPSPWSLPTTHLILQSESISPSSLSLGTTNLLSLFARLNPLSPHLRKRRRRNHNKRFSPPRRINKLDEASLRRRLSPYYDPEAHGDDDVVLMTTSDFYSYSSEDDD